MGTFGPDGWPGLTLSDRELVEAAVAAGTAPIEPRERRWTRARAPDSLYLTIGGVWLEPWSTGDGWDVVTEGDGLYVETLRTDGTWHVVTWEMSELAAAQP